MNPRTGTKNLPDATRNPTAISRGVGIYQPHGILIDADLFRRLRLRGQARGGEDGHDDLRAALALVQGEPFDQLRNGEWLTDGDRIDHHLTAAIADVRTVLGLST